MKKVICFLAALLILLAACSGDGNDVNSVSADPTEVNVVVEEAPTEPAAPATAMPEPTDTPESNQDLITSADEMIGIWLGTVAAEYGYVMYTADGRFLLALSQEALATAPLVSGEYWFEDDQIHLRDLENVGHWAECEVDTVGVYDVVNLGDGQMQFQMVNDGCGDSGFTRSYVFTNMKQEWVAEPVEVVAP